MAAEKSSDTSIVEVREELMVSPTPTGERERPTLRNAHFLKPTFDPISRTLFPPKPELPSLSHSSKPKVAFNGRRRPLKKWKTWVEKMQPTHEPIWKKVGIFDAIHASTYQILRQNDVVINLGERWCPETNTFIFPWGEVTITLEDVMVLGGYPVLGDSVLSSSPQRQNIELLENKLVMALRQIRERINPTVTHACWLEEFMGSGVELEHAGFLALWLSRHVFPPRSSSYIRSSLFSLAARLSNGMKIALAPVVLANIYRDLSLLKDKIAGSSSKGSNDESLVLSAPFQLVQLWAWERFPTLAPIPRVITHGEPRLARWSKLRNPTFGDLSMALDSPKEAFVWRPYATNVENFSLACFYGDMEKWVSLDSGGPWESFARCLRVCQLVGLDCIQEYLPHRVAMQFGMDQDIPSSVPIVHETLKVTWNNYNRPITGVKLYVPSRMFKGYVTARYSDWWKGVPLSQAGSIQSSKQPRTDQCNSYGLTAIMNAKTQGKHFDKNDGQKPVESFHPCSERNQNSKLSLAYGLPNKNDKGENQVSPLMVPNNELAAFDGQQENQLSAIANIITEDINNDDETGLANTSNLNDKVESQGHSPKGHLNEPEACGGQQENRAYAIVPIENEDFNKYIEASRPEILQVHNQRNADDEVESQGKTTVSPSNARMAYDETQVKMWSWVDHEGIVRISDDVEEDDTGEYPFESIPFELEARISKLEQEVSRLNALKFGQDQHPINWPLDK